MKNIANCFSLFLFISTFIAMKADYSSAASVMKIIDHHKQEIRNIIKTDILLLPNWLAKQNETIKLNFEKFSSQKGKSIQIYMEREFLKNALKNILAETQQEQKNQRNLCKKLEEEGDLIFTKLGVFKDVRAIIAVYPTGLGICGTLASFIAHKLKLSSKFFFGVSGGFFSLITICGLINLNSFHRNCKNLKNKLTHDYEYNIEKARNTINILNSAITTIDTLQSQEKINIPALNI